MTKEDQNSKDSNNFTKILVIVALIVVTVALYFLVATPSVKKPEARGSSGAGHTEAAQYADIGGEFTLIDQDGKEFKSESLKGKIALIYFGFTFCPDICPTTLQKITNVMTVMDKYTIDVTPVFITIDPARDNTSLLKQYISNFHPKFIGLSGSAEDVKKAADLYKVFFEPVPGSDKGHNDYLVNHTSFIYLMDKNGHYVKHFDSAATPEEIVEFIRINLK